MKQRTKRTIHFSSLLSNSINEWVDAFLPLFRAAIPMIMLNVIAPHIQSIHIQPLELTLPVSLMYGLTIVAHAFSAASSLCMDYNHGFLYETSRVILPSEFILFFYFLRDNTVLAIMLLAMLACSTLLLLTKGCQHLIRCHQHGYIPHTLFRDIIFSLKKAPSPSTLIHAALRRYLVISVAILFFFPSVTAFSVLYTAKSASFCNASASAKASAEKQLLQHTHEIYLLSDDQWHLLSVQDKTIVLQIVADIETNHMQINSVTVKNCHLENNVIGAYNPLTREVQIDLEKHKGYSSLEYINTILHECRHAYQHDCIESLNWNDPSIQSGIYYAQARQWRYEHQHYISSSEDKEAYYLQAIEKDARYYAEDGVHWYQKYMYSDPLLVP